jgi:hypothetical protein
MGQLLLGLGDGGCRNAVSLMLFWFEYTQWWVRFKHMVELLSVCPRKFLSFEFLRFIIWFRGFYLRHDATILFVYYSLNGRRRGIHVEVLPSLCSPMRTSAIYTWLASPARLKKGFHIPLLPQHKHQPENAHPTDWGGWGNQLQSHLPALHPAPRINHRPHNPRPTATTKTPRRINNLLFIDSSDKLFPIESSTLYSFAPYFYPTGPCIIQIVGWPNA